MQQTASRRLPSSRRPRMHRIRMIEVIMSVNIGLAQHCSGGVRNCRSMNHYLSRQSLVEMWIYYRQRNLLAIASGCNGCGTAKTCERS